MHTVGAHFGTMLGLVGANIILKNSWQRVSKISNLVIGFCIMSSFRPLSRSWNTFTKTNSIAKSFKFKNIKTSSKI